MNYLDEEWENYQRVRRLIGRKWAGSIIKAAQEGKLEKLEKFFYERYFCECFSIPVDFGNAKIINDEIIPLRILKRAYLFEGDFLSLFFFLDDLKKRYQEEK